jgi:hypothetical protein
MRAIPILVAVLALLPAAGCHRKTEGEAVRDVYENKADAIDAQAAQQPTPVARTIYKHQADALRDEGKDREKGLEGGTPSKGQGGGPTAGGAMPSRGNP